jgi:hypothetical protein
MIYQLPNGRIIELSVEQFLELDDVEVRELNGLSSAYSLECSNPFYNLYSTGSQVDKLVVQELIYDDEFEPDLFDIINLDPTEKFEDDYFHPDDI